MSVKIGPYTLPSNVLLAPMAGVTDRPFRILCRRFGAGLAASEMLSADMKLWDTPKSRRRMDHEGEPSPRVVQIAGYDPAMMAEAAQRNVDAGAQIIDINMGCPAKKVCNRLAGSALLQDEALVARILHTVVGCSKRARHLEDPHRLGSAQQERTQHRADRARCWNSSACDSRAHSHRYVSGRMLSTQPVAIIKGNVQDTGVSRTATSIRRSARAKQILIDTGCDGIMIGRAAQGRPWIFDEVNFFLSNGELRADLALEKVRDIMRAHLEDLYAFYGDETGVRVARKHLSWYFRQHPGQEALRNRLVHDRDTARATVDVVGTLRHSVSRRMSACIRFAGMNGRPWSQKRNRNLVVKSRPLSTAGTLKVNGKGVPLRSQARRGAAELFRNAQRPQAGASL